MASYDEWKEKSSIWPRIGLAILIILAIGACSLFGFIVHLTSGGVRSTPARNIEADGIAASTFCKDVVGERLKAPSTAKFPWLADDVRVTPDEQTFIIKSHVDSQNSFGAMLRTNFMCRLKYTGGGADGWVLEDISTK